MSGSHTQGEFRGNGCHPRGSGSDREVYEQVSRESGRLSAVKTHTSLRLPRYHFRGQESQEEESYRQ